MSHDQPGGDPVGSLADEAAKLFGALSEWTRDQARDQGDAAGQAAHGLADAVRGVSDHLATGGEDCRYCPVCQVIHAVRDTNPEVRQHLASAASSLLHAAAGLLETQHRGDRPGGPVHKIDLDDVE